MKEALEMALQNALYDKEHNAGRQTHRHVVAAGGSKRVVKKICLQLTETSNADQMLNHDNEINPRLAVGMIY